MAYQETAYDLFIHKLFHPANAIITARAVVSIGADRSDSLQGRNNNEPDIQIFSNEFFQADHLSPLPSSLAYAPK